MTMAEYRLKAVPVFAEKVEGDLTQLVDLADRWGASITIHPELPITLTLYSGAAYGAARTAHVGEWLIDKSGEGKGVCTDVEFTTVFEPTE